MLMSLETNNFIIEQDTNIKSRRLSENPVILTFELEVI